ncbi:MAG TPA: T9SS type A sorting domain-containing protein [Saprospiraceae bacterium]|nr:T9SS type A sorting domain-containing protein [Saprospiraceae bacterium]
MKFLNTLFLVLLSVTMASSQITVTNTTFPAIGDTLKYRTTGNPSSPVNVGSTNGPQTWNFNFLNSGGFEFTEIYLNPILGQFEAFPISNLMILTEDGQEQYLRTSATKLEAIGFAGENGFLPTNLAIKYTDKPILRVAPLDFITSNNSNGKFNVDISTDILPDSLLGNLPIDSIRIQFSGTTSGLVDAFGSLLIQNKTFEVLREKSTVTTKTDLFVKIPFLGWQNPANLGFDIPGGFGEFFGIDTSIVYNFYTNTRKEILVSAEFNAANEFQSVSFADVGGIISSSYDISVNHAMTLYPNPATQFINIETKDWKEGLYFLTITDMSGRVVFFENTKLSENDKKQISTIGLSAGQYIFTARDKFNQGVRSIKFVIN